jgi:hypothetical protein
MVIYAKSWIWGLDAPRKSPPKPLHPPIATVKLASDWLGVDLEVRSLCFATGPDLREEIRGLSGVAGGGGGANYKQCICLCDIKMSC